MTTRKSQKKRKPLAPRRVVQPDRKTIANSSRRRTFPFTAIVGQDEMKLALILNVIEPRIGGVLIMGHRGTGKSTAVRALAELLPEMEVVADCLYHCDPKDTINLCGECRSNFTKGRKLPTDLVPVRVIELPLGATEDRLCGTIDIERAIKAGTKAFEPGLLARANRGFLYIDEVNLLEDHLVDILLDAAATGRNRVERESISIDHPAQFVLVGSGNPEEGELRPQLQDRFGLHVEIATENKPELRAEVVEKRVAFDRDPEAFVEFTESDEARLREQINQARLRVETIELDRDLLSRIAQLCSDLKIDGHRGELTIARAARALAAFEARSRVDVSDVRRVAAMSVRHRLRRDPLEQSASSHQVNDALDRVLRSDSMAPSESAGRRRRAAGDTRRDRATRPDEGPSTNGADGPLAPAQETSAIAQIPELNVSGRRSTGGSASSNHSTRKSKKKSNGLSTNDRGRYQRSTIEKTSRVALDATLRAVAATESAQSRRNGCKISVKALRYKVLARKDGPLFIFAIDTSGSMARQRIALAKNALLNVLRKAYLNRDRVAIVGFSGTNAKLLLPPCRSILRARRVLDGLMVGGGTPLSAALRCSLHLANRVSAKQRSSTVLLLFTDGGANVPLSRSDVRDRTEREQSIAEEISILGSELRRANVTTVVVATNHAFQSNRKANELADCLKAQIVYASNPSVTRN